MAEYDQFRKAIKTESALDRMKDAELVLRFLAFHEKSCPNYPGGVKSFLNEFMNDFRNISDDRAKKFSEAFKKAADLAYTVFGENAFRRFSAGNKKDQNGRWEKTVNRALYDILMWGFTQYEKPEVIENSDAIRESLIALILEDDDFREAITAATGDRNRVIHRFESWRKRLADVIGTNGSNPRLFSTELKKELMAASPMCQICGQTIQTLDDAEVDHIKPYSKGGETTGANAQLTHRHCNRSKGARG